MVVHPRLRAPADVESRKYVFSRPLENIFELVPVIHILKRHHFHRRAGYDQPVELEVFYIVKRLVKTHQMLDGGVLCLVASGLEKFRFHLQGRIAQQAQKLRLGFNFCGHQV